MVIERENVLGGHSNTYIDPVTKQAVDYGVVVFENLPVVKDYFDYLKIQWESSHAFGAYKVTNYDFSKCKIVNNVTVPNPQNALQAYVAQLMKYPKLQDGFFIPNPVPDDLLLPFGEFIIKYKIEEVAGLAWQFHQGIGDFLRQPTLYVLKDFGLNIVQKDLVDGFIVPKCRNNLKIYSKACKLLQGNVLLNSYPIRIVRNNCENVEVTVKTPRGLILVRAKKLLVTIPPSHLYGFDLNSHETKIFKQFKYTGYYTGLIRNAGLPANVTFKNINTNNPYGLPTLPALYAIEPTIVGGLVDVKYCSLQLMKEKDVKADILASIAGLQKAGIATETCNEPEFAAFNSHVPFQLTVSTEAIKSGFYDQLYGLQGKRNTYWTGAAFQAQNSGLIWKFTDENVIPRLVESLCATD